MARFFIFKSNLKKMNINILLILLMILGLSLGIFENSLVTGKALSKINFMQALKVAFILILIQIPVLIAGWFSGEKFEAIVQNYDRWIPLSLLAAIGIKMIFESFKLNSKLQKLKSLTINLLLGIVLAILIDTLLIGMSFAFFNYDLLLILLISTVVSFFAALLGLVLGKKMNKKFQSQIKIIGGFILIGSCLNLLLLPQV